MAQSMLRKIYIQPMFALYTASRRALPKCHHHNFEVTHVTSQGYLLFAEEMAYNPKDQRWSLVRLV